MEKLVGPELRYLSNLILRQAERKRSGEDLERITGRNGWIIAYLYKNEGKDVFQKDLEATFGITRSTASKVVILMEKKGLVSRSGVLQDARLKKLSLTPKARKLCSEMNQRLHEIESTLTQGFTPEELDQFLSFIERMKTNMK